MREEFYYPSRDGRTQIHAVEWTPGGEVRGVLQICHGMVEYIERYHEFADYMCGHGYYVTASLLWMKRITGISRRRTGISA